MVQVLKEAEAEAAHAEHSQWGKSMPCCSALRTPTSKGGSRKCSSVVGKRAKQVTMQGSRCREQERCMRGLGVMM